jgi:hypothetical protein
VENARRHLESDQGSERVTRIMTETRTKVKGEVRVTTKYSNIPIISSHVPYSRTIVTSQRPIQPVMYKITSGLIH